MEEYVEYRKFFEDGYHYNIESGITLTIYKDNIEIFKETKQIEPTISYILWVHKSIIRKKKLSRIQ